MRTPLPLDFSSLVWFKRSRQTTEKSVARDEVREPKSDQYLVVAMHTHSGFASTVLLSLVSHEVADFSLTVLPEFTLDLKFLTRVETRSFYT